MGLDNPVHLLLLGLVVLLVFGAKRLPEIGRSLGEGMRGFKDSVQPGMHGEHHVSLPSHDAVPAPAAVIAAPPAVAVLHAQDPARERVDAAR